MIWVKARRGASGDHHSVMNQPPFTLDVCDDLKAGREPLSRILKAVSGLHNGQGLRLVAPFKPVPLFFVLGRMGFSHQETMIEPGRWEVLFEPSSDRAAAATPASRHEEIAPTAASTHVEVDARGLEPPQPMIAILEALAALPDWAELHAYTDRRPVHLYPQLEARGFTGVTEELPDGSHLTRIRRA